MKSWEAETYIMNLPIDSEKKIQCMVGVTGYIWQSSIKEKKKRSSKKNGWLVKAEKRGK